ncbi:MAG: flagellar protein FlgN [Verrucomicrobiota bacterium]
MIRNLDTADSGMLCQELVRILRAELQEYGGLLNLLDDQQEKILSRDSQELMTINKQIELQADANRLLKETRERIVGRLVSDWGADSANTKITQLVRFFPEAMQPMVNSIADEINELIRKSRRRLEQNRLLLKRLSSITEEMLSFINPDLVPSKTYSHKGSMQVKAPVSTPSSVEMTA